LISLDNGNTDRFHDASNHSEMLVYSTSANIRQKATGPKVSIRLPFAARPFTVHRSPFAVRRSPFAVHRSPLARLLSERGSENRCHSMVRDD
jgi:hypothetical protein